MTASIGTALVIFFALCGAGILAVLLAPEGAQARVLAWAGALAALPLAWAGAAALAGLVDAATWHLWTIPSLGAITLSVDRLAGLFLLVTALVSFPAAVFIAASLPALAPRYRLRGFGIGYLGLVASVALVLLAADVFTFLVAWEVMSLLCYLLVSYEHEAAGNTQGGYLLLALSEAGALAVAVGLLLMAARVDALDFAALRAGAPGIDAGLQWTVFLLTFFGFGVKAGLVPVNPWLPRAYAAAPAAFIPVLAGATLNLGLYGILRVNADLLPLTSEGPGTLALIVGTLTAIIGILYATTENDLKTLLAHSSIENAGIITVGVGAGLLFGAAGQPALAGIAYIAALYHLINHSFYKTLLFIGAGTVERQTGTRDLNRLGGLIHRLPWTALGLLAGVLAIAALPPFNGFVSEWLTLQTLLGSAALASTAVKVVFALCGAVLALTAALAVTCFVKMFAMSFLGVSRSTEAASAGEAPRAAYWPMLLLAAGCLLLGVTPTYVIPVLDGAMQPITHHDTLAAIVPPFFAGSPRHAELPATFVEEFHAIGAQVGQSALPGSGLVIMHRGGEANPVVYAASPFWLAVVLVALLLVTWLLVRLTAARRRSVVRQPCWDGAVRRLLPEMTYTATGFSNPVRVIFDAVFRPTTVEDTRETVGQHFRAAILHERDDIHLIDRGVLHPAHAAAFGFAALVARIHHGRLNTYITYVLLSLLAALLLSGWLR
jgi:hydrogenase-4 component B